MKEDLIPIIDFTSCGLNVPECSREDLLKSGKALLNAFSDVGFVYLKNVGIERSLVDKIFKETEKFFTSPLEEKLPYKRKPGTNFGYIGTGEEKTNPNAPYEFKEAFTVNGGSFDLEKKEWPDQKAPCFSTMMEEFMKQAGELSMRILNALALAMDIKDEHYFEKRHSLRHTSETYTCGKVFYYPAVTEQLEENQSRCASHADETSISLLYQDEIGGLQIQNVEGEFVDAIPVKDAVIINIGNTLQLWTKGKLKSTIHRVALPQDKNRLKIARRSLAYFLHPNNDAPINEPIDYNDESLNETAEEKEKRGEIMTSEQYIHNRLRTFWKYN